MVITPIQKVTGVAITLDDIDASHLDKILGAYVHAHQGSVDAVVADRATFARYMREDLQNYLSHDG